MTKFRLVPSSTVVMRMEGSADCPIQARLLALSGITTETDRLAFSALIAKNIEVRGIPLKPTPGLNGAPSLGC